MEKNKINIPVKNTQVHHNSPTNERGNISIQGFIKIYDPRSNIIFVNKRT